MMGFLATFNGVIYNEFFAIPTNIFTSCYEEEIKVLNNVDVGNGTAAKDVGYMRTIEAGQTSCVYPLGLDPRWFQSD